MRAVLLATLLVWCAGCGDPGKARLVRLADNKELTEYRLQAVHGHRDEDHLRASVVFSGRGSELALDLRFLIGVPTHLEWGHYRWGERQGAVAERSVTFLGGQSGPPSVGGTFDLLSGQGAAVYRVHMPVTELK